MEGSGRTPIHLWIVGVLALAWNGFGCLDYVMTQTQNAAWFDAMKLTDAQRAFYAGFPTYADVAWALGVWGGLLGSVLLLARSRWAVIAFGLSLLGFAGGMTYHYLLSSAPPEMTTTGMNLINLVIALVCIGQFVYAREMRSRGVLG